MEPFPGSPVVKTVHWFPLLLSSDTWTHVPSPGQDSGQQRRLFVGKYIFYPHTLRSTRISAHDPLALWAADESAPAALSPLSHAIVSLCLYIPLFTYLLSSIVLASGKALGWSALKREDRTGILVTALGYNFDPHGVFWRAGMLWGDNDGLGGKVMMSICSGCERKEPGLDVLFFI